MIKLSVFLKNRLSDWKPEYFDCLGYSVSCGYPTRVHTHSSNF